MSKTPELANPTACRQPLLVDLALQGGGAHGACTWGVLDRLLEESWLTIDSISGRSAGAMNAAVTASGHAHGGADGAKAALEDFWKRASDASRFSPMRRGLLEMLTGQWTLAYSPMYMAAEMMSRVFSPYDLNPSGVNPLSAILADTVDFECLASSPIRLFITATSVRTGSGHVFRNAEITPDVLLASGCLPTLFQAVEIGGEFYWDGGYAGNPTITPLVRECDSHDTILVQINPVVVRDAIPKSARDILSRLNEVSFNSPLLKELRMIALLHKVADPGHGEGAQWARMRIHRIATDRVTELDSTSKMITEWRFLCGLRDEGRRRRSRSSMPTAATWARGPASIWRPCSRRCEMAQPSSALRSLLPRRAPRRLRATRCSPTGRRPSWVRQRASLPSSFRCSCLGRCSAS